VKRVVVLGSGGAGTTRPADELGRRAYLAAL
jgi:hypothetical protein